MASDEERVGLDTEELPRVRDSYTYVADPRLLKRLERQQQEAASFVRPPNPPLWLGELPNHMDPSDWRAGYLKVRELEPSDYWLTEMYEVSPQALLRDLYRPERETFWCELERHPALDRGGAAAVAEARAAQQRDPIPVIQPLLGEVMGHRNSWRRFLRDQWKPLIDDEQPRKYVSVHRDPSINW
jgi:hypothetical protein